MVEKFSNVDCKCDRCNAHLIDQSGFDDHKSEFELGKDIDKMMESFVPVKDSETTISKGA
jgi:hypothetical protein